MAGRTCRQCSECDGNHHWLDNSECYGPDDPSHVCKHCDALGDECDGCGGSGEDFETALCAECGGYGVIVAATPTSPPSPRDPT